MADTRTRAEKLADMAASEDSPREAAIARRKLAELLAREGEALSRATVDAAANSLSAVARAYLIAEYERWAKSASPRHTREWRA